MTITTLAEDRNARKALIDAVKACGISEREAMDLLQENNQVSDECVRLEDVAGADATGPPTG